MTRAMTWWAWICPLLLFGLAGCVLYQWFFIIKESSYTIDYFGPILDAKQRAQLGRLGIYIVLPVALVTYFRSPRQIPLPVRLFYLGAVGLAGAVLLIYWTTNFLGRV